MPSYELVRLHPAIVHDRSGLVRFHDHGWVARLTFLIGFHTPLEVDGGRYYTQTEFSNRAFAAFGAGNGCQQSETTATTRPSASGAGATSIFSYATPDVLPGDGRSTSSIQTQVTDADGNGIGGDRMSYSTYTVSGTGTCGGLSASTATTDGDGNATVSYTASRADLVCAVVATDAAGGASSTAAVYQGTFQRQAIRAGDTFPGSVRAGGVATFTTSFTNPTSTPIVHAEIDLVVFPGDRAVTDVTARQLRLLYSTTGPHSRFVPAALTGSTIGNGEIDAVIGRAGGASIAAGATRRIDYRLYVDGRVVSPRGRGPLLSLEAYVNQINPATASGTNLADTFSTDLSVLPR